MKDFLKDPFMLTYDKSHKIQNKEVKELLQFILLCETTIKHPDSDYVFSFDNKKCLIDEFIKLESEIENRNKMIRLLMNIIIKINKEKICFFDVECKSIKDLINCIPCIEKWLIRETESKEGENT